MTYWREFLLLIFGTAFAVLFATALFAAENEGCLECNVSVFELRYGKTTLQEFDDKETCDAAIQVAKGWPGLECVEVYVQRYEG